jgi:hypothetical protein
VKKPDVVPEQLLLQFPLERIQKLKIDRIAETFFTLPSLPTFAEEFFLDCGCCN